MRSRRRITLARFAGAELAIVGVMVGCAQAFLSPSLRPRTDIPATTTEQLPLKVHMRSGELYMLSNWKLGPGKTLSGSGPRYDVSRVRLDSTEVTIPVDSVALVETNDPSETYTFGLQGIGVMTIAGAAVSVACLSDPKSCFGSCPTFYVEGDHATRVQAEGFSASVARVLEARDVDALPDAGARGRTLGIHMRNEAWETHMVRRVALLTVPRPPNGRVFAAADSSFYMTRNPQSPAACVAAEGDCNPALATRDNRERSSPADSTDLAAREVVDLTFAHAPVHAALVLTARNSLVTTFLFYQTMAYVGSNMGSVLAAMERGGRTEAESSFGMARLLGGIEVQLRDSAGEWQTVGMFGEPGPIAADTKVVPLPLALLPRDGALHIRLRMAKGSWRVDWASLAELGERVVPTRVLPAAVERGGHADDRALSTLRSGSSHLVTLPGDDYRLVFALPQPAEQLDLFLESEGYYYEWMRREWLAEENPLMAAFVIGRPAEALRVLAPAYKAGESRMEDLFWSSRFTRRPADVKER